MVLGLGLVVIAVLVGVAFVARLARRPATGARIHVDDLAVGAGPAVCAMTGVPTDNLVEVSSTEGGFQAWWLLLLLFGPVGIVALLIVAATARRPGRVGGMLPVTHAAVVRYRAVARTSQWAMVAAGVLMLVGFSLAMVGNAPRGLVVAGGVALLALIVLALGATIAAGFRWVDLRLDGSGRWVEVTRAHPDYARALHHHNARVHVR